jgi:signal transduction histidine kinase
MSEGRVKSKKRKPGFFWQGVLILAPMLVLAKLGALAIWQDKRMAQHEAELRAQDLAEQAADRLSVAWLAFQASNTDTILIDFDGNLLRPNPVRPDASTQTARLTPEQSDLLHRARLAEFTGANGRDAVNLFQQFLAAAPPPESAQQARYSLALLFMSAGDETNATRLFRELINDPSPAPGDAGGDLKSLALLKLALLSQSSFDAACSNAVANPTPLTPQVLRTVYNQSQPEAKATAERWWNAWQRDELNRHLYTQLRPFLQTNTATGTNKFRSLKDQQIEPPPWLWVGVTNEDAFTESIRGESSPARGANFEDSSLLASTSSRYTLSGRLDTARFLERRPDPSGFALAVYRAPALAAWANASIERLRAPEYFGVSVVIGNYDVIQPKDLPAVVVTGGGKGAGRTWVKTYHGDPPAALATASRVNGPELPFLVRVHLTGKDLLSEQQSARSLWIRMVLVVAGVCAIIGFISAYRAFDKQLRLADMKSNFVSSVSHELRAPIASVRLMAEGLERGTISEPTKQQEYFRFITQECRRLSSMIENVLDFARIEQGRKQYEFEPTDVTALVEETVKLMEPYAAERGVRLVVAAEVTRLHSNGEERGDVQRDDQSLLTSAATIATIDGQAIHQALVNLIDNAIKHSPEGSEVHVALTINQQLSTLYLSVEDSGPGIPVTEHEKIFERFYRLGSELRRETPGVGIGLSIVKHVVEAHGGRVHVDSKTGEGSRFTIELPINAEAADRQPAETL